MFHRARRCRPARRQADRAGTCRPRPGTASPLSSAPASIAPIVWILAVRDQLAVAFAAGVLDAGDDVDHFARSSVFSLSSRGAPSCGTSSPSGHLAVRAPRSGRRARSPWWRRTVPAAAGCRGARACAGPVRDRPRRAARACRRTTCRCPARVRRRCRWRATQSGPARRPARTRRSVRGRSPSSCRGPRTRRVSGRRPRRCPQRSRSTSDRDTYRPSTYCCARMRQRPRPAATSRPALAVTSVGWPRPRRSDAGSPCSRRPS